MILRILNQHLTLLKEEARKTYPVEACALIFGRLTEKEVLVERVVVTPNVLKSTLRFEIGSEAFYDAFTKAAEDGLEFIGFFHSHPAPAQPSSVDLQFMRLWGDAVWLICSSIDSEFGAFQMKRSRVYALTLRTEENLRNSCR